MGSEMEVAIMQLITHGGNTRSASIQAIREARNGNFESADALLAQANEQMNEAHQAQTQLIFAETNGNPVPLSLLMVHAQDHVMNAMTVKDLASEMVAMMKVQGKEH